MLENEQYDQSIDWWSFAVLLYRMLTGKVCTYMFFLFLNIIISKFVGIQPSVKPGFSHLSLAQPWAE